MTPYQPHKFEHFAKSFSFCLTIYTQRLKFYWPHQLNISLQLLWGCQLFEPSHSLDEKFYEFPRGKGKRLTEHFVNLMKSFFCKYRRWLIGWKLFYAPLFLCWISCDEIHFTSYRFSFRIEAHFKNII